MYLFKELTRYLYLRFSDAILGNNFTSIGLPRAQIGQLEDASGSSLDD